MPRITIELPTALYSELREVASATREKGYTAKRWAEDCVASELAARRLPHVDVGRYGARIAEPIVAPEPYRINLTKQE